MKGPGCPRCRKDEIRFIESVKLPRFSVTVGDVFAIPQSYFLPDGSFYLGCFGDTGQIARRGTFEVVRRDVERAKHGPEGCPGEVRP